MKIIKRLILLLSCTMIVSCVNPINDHTYHKYQRLSQEASRSGNLEAAEEYDKRAIVNARIGNLGDEKLAQALHNLALTKHDLCKLDESEELLLEAIRIREKMQADGSLKSENKKYLIGSYLELSALYFSRNKYKESIPGFEKVLPEMRVATENTDNGKYMLSSFLNEYAIALEKARKIEKMNTIRAEEKKVLSGEKLTYVNLASILRHPKCK